VNHSPSPSPSFLCNFPSFFSVDLIKIADVILVSKLFDRIWGKKGIVRAQSYYENCVSRFLVEMRILMVGLDAAGKTTILFAFLVHLSLTGVFQVQTKIGRNR
jgi:ADP-ribosylation factor family